MNPKNNNDIYLEYINDMLLQMKQFRTPEKTQEEKTQEEKDEEILDKMNIKTIENYLRKKKLQNISNNK